MGTSAPGPIMLVHARNIVLHYQGKKQDKETSNSFIKKIKGDQQLFKHRQLSGPLFIYINKRR